MLRIEIEKRLTTALSWGVLCVTLIITDRVSTDPVNVGKMVSLAVLAGSILALVLPYLRGSFSTNRQLLGLILAFLIVGLISIFVSTSPWEHGFYGAFGRNTGFLTYLSLVIIFISAFSLRRVKSYIQILRFFFIAGAANILYCLYTLSGHDFIKWVNPYGKPIGTFGNPDFISSFMGIFATVILAFLLSSGISKFQRSFFLFLLILALIVIRLTGASQGIVVSIFGAGIVCFYFIRSNSKSAWVSQAYLGAGLTSSLFAVLGMLQIGPLTKYLYKPSITFRGEYWQAGINMGKHNPLFGVGMDSFGLFYRTFRDSSALKYPGVDTVTDAAHNVFIDVFAGTGLFGFLAYIGILVMVAISALKYSKSHKEFDPVFVAIFGAWITYQMQSFISINQIGLAIWGWLFGGLLIGYTSISNRDSQKQALNIFNRISRKTEGSKGTVQPLSAGLSLLSLVGAAVALLVALPPFVADAKMRNTMSGSVTTEAISSAALSWPQDNLRMNKAMIELANNGKTAEAEILAASAVLKYPHDYAALWVLYKLTTDGSPQKAAYKTHLHELDPYNPEFAPK